ncbi:MAG: endolytic transglycosylase MltG [Gammaproteobacteria bacterium]|nr:endolytic transglycosylase MltG [Gammaproteobacteria bacterium]
MTTFKRALFIILGLFFPIFLGTCLFWLDFTHTSMIHAKEGVKYNVAPGATYKTISTDLYKQHLISHSLLFNILVRLDGNIHKLKAGEYLFPYGATPLHVLNQIMTGTGLIYHTFTIIPGSTFAQMRLVLNNNAELKHTSMNLSDAELMKRLGSSYTNPEGLFFPDTYYFVLGTPDLTLLKNAYHAMQTKLNAAWQHRAPNLPFKTSYEVLIAASIIEKETGLNEERPIIAGVLENRLRLNMLLQFDPTVIYGLGSRYTGKIYLTNLRENNPYNTYVVKGLPPTPISMPSLISINAVTQPDNNDYLYFVAKGYGSGHQFSRTLSQHNAAVSVSRVHLAGNFNVELIQKYLIKTFRKEYPIARVPMK